MSAHHAIPHPSGPGSSQQESPTSLIGDILDRGVIVTGLQASSKKKLLESAAMMFADRLPDTDAGQILSTLIDRENLGSTGIGHGVALPHGRIQGLDEVIGIFLRLEEPLDFDAVDHLPVNLVFAILVPQDATEEHLKLLASLACVFRDEETRDRLLNTSDTKMIREIFETPVEQDACN